MVGTHRAVLRGPLFPAAMGMLGSVRFAPTAIGDVTGLWEAFDRVAR